MVAHALINRASSFRYCRGLCFIDNVASLMCLIRGRSDSSDLEKICHFIHMVLFALEAVLFWEYIPSKSNWADPILRGVLVMYGIPSTTSLVSSQSCLPTYWTSLFQLSSQS